MNRMGLVIGCWQLLISTLNNFYNRKLIFFENFKLENISTIIIIIMVLEQVHKIALTWIIDWLIITNLLSKVCIHSLS